jgi:acyl-CoA synthetase (AMP-forming)/AMP-acid ligase II/peptidoglycan/LPS O-acetylase OafA/YrhL
MFCKPDACTKQSLKHRLGVHFIRWNALIAIRSSLLQRKNSSPRRAYPALGHGENSLSILHQRRAVAFAGRTHNESPFLRSNKLNADNISANANLALQREIGRELMISDLTRRIASLPPHAIAALDDRGGLLTYSQLAHKTGTLVAALGPVRSLILLEAENSVEWLVAYMAALRGRHVVLMAPNNNQAAFTNLDATFHPTIHMSVENNFAPRCVGDHDLTLHPDLALMLSTSGSTGSAKCVRLSHENLAANAESISHYLDLDASERALANLPVHYSYGLSVVHSHLWVGAALLLTGRSVIDEEYWAFGTAHGATSFAGVPHSYDLLSRIDLPRHAPSTLRYFTQAGGRLPEAQVCHFGELARKHSWRFYVMYGQTEATARMSYLPPSQTLQKPGSIGVPIPQGAFSLVDETGEVISQSGVPGQLVYRGPNVMMGYASSANDLATPGGPQVLHTGDLAVRDEDGFYRITGRLSRFIKIFGNRLGLDDVEQMLASENYPSIATGVDDQLLVVTRGGDTDAISQVIQERLKLPPAYFAVQKVAEYPLLASGKVDYASLRDALPPTKANADNPAAGQPEADFDPGAVAAVYKACFGDAAIEEGASFESLGGDSLNYMVVAIGLEKLLGTLPEGWTGQSIAELTALDRAGRRQGISIRPRTTAMNLDTLRALACVLVVMFHVVGNTPDFGLKLPANSGWHSFVNLFRDIRMPLFTAMAGFLYAMMPARRGEVGKFLARKARLLLLPMMFVMTVSLIGRNLVYGGKDSIVLAFTHGYLHLWYLYAIMVIFIIAAPADAWISRSWRFWLAMVAAAPAVQWLVSFPLVFCINRGESLLCFFALGVAVDRQPALLRSNALLGIALLVAGGSLAWRVDEMILDIPPNVWLTYPAGCAWIFAALRLFPRIEAIEGIGAYSFTIYLWHPLANSMVRLILIQIGLTWLPLLFVVGIIGGVGLPILLHRIMLRLPMFSLPFIGR